MEGLEWLCACCKNEKCNKKIIIENSGNCKNIKCLDFIRDEEKIKPLPKFEYVIRSDKL